MIDITVQPAEEGAAKATVSFTDENGAAVTPTSLKWSLCNKAGTIINSRDHVTLTPGPSVSWLISGDDLAITESLVGRAVVERFIVIDALYTSTLGSNIPLRAQARFSIEGFLV